jgi:predicted DNA-binding protein (MmcQ/YjbR family)
LKIAKRHEKVLDQVRAICLAFPETYEVEAWEHPTFRAGKKMFAAFGDHDSDLTLGIKVGFDRQDVLLRNDRFFPTPYAARQGWVSLRLNGKTDWNEIAGLIREAYCQVALQRMLKALDEKK